MDEGWNKSRRTETSLFPIPKSKGPMAGPVLFSWDRVQGPEESWVSYVSFVALMTSGLGSPGSFVDGLDPFLLESWGVITWVWDHLTLAPTPPTNEHVIERFHFSTAP